ncbi:MAG: amino acid ABC transporter substrate-binding protein [Methylocystaceae bacterium]|nr:amino acid ABC transporter substrate-binding protein [Methylocystaceae bacterium]
MRMILLLWCFILSFAGIHQAYGATLDDVRARGFVLCGVDEQHFGFSYLDEQGQWQGFEVAFCKGLAAAIFKDPQKVKFVGLNAQNRFNALKNKTIDVLFRSATLTYKRDTSLGLDFPAVIFYDYMAILSHKSLGAKSLKDVKDAVACVAHGTTTFETMREYVYRTGAPIKIKSFNTREGLNDFFFSGQCNLYAADHSALLSILVMSTAQPQDYVFLTDILAKEPLSPAVREDDKEWFEIVKWMIHGLIEAEERNITQANVTQMKNDSTFDTRFLLGAREGVGKPVRLSDDWLMNAISAVGNYGEIFERYLGASSPLKMKRGMNALWNQGGLMYGQPIR